MFDLNSKSNVMRLSKFLKKQESEVRRQRRRAFGNFLENTGWTHRILFMGGGKWTRGDDTLIRGLETWRLNGQIITKENLLRFVNEGIPAESAFTDLSLIG